jgi:hypothetical protein
MSRERLACRDSSGPNPHKTTGAAGDSSCAKHLPFVLSALVIVALFLVSVFAIEYLYDIGALPITWRPWRD